MVTFYSL